MKKILALLAVTTIPALLSGCSACCPMTSGLCPCCPCNWFNRAPACPPAPVACPPVACAPTTFAAPQAATACPPPCAPVCPPMASQVMPQYISPAPMSFAASAPCSSCQQQPMMMQAQPAYYSEPSCAYNAAFMEPGCGYPSSNVVSYGPMMDCGCCDGGCSGGCCDGGSTLAAPAPEQFTDPRPTGE